MRGTRSSTYLKADGLEEEVGGEEVEVPAEAADEGGEVGGEGVDDSKHFGSFRRVPEQDGVACSFTSTVSNLAESSNPLALLTPPRAARREHSPTHRRTSRTISELAARQNSPTNYPHKGAFAHEGERATYASTQPSGVIILIY